MKLILLAILLLSSISLFSQLNVDELDREINRATKGKLQHFRKGTKPNILSVYAYKSDGKIFSVMNREEFKSGKKVDSLIGYQFGFINDTLLRVWYMYDTFTSKDKIRGMIMAYISHDKIVALKVSGNTTLPSIQTLIEKSNALKIQAIELVNLSKSNL